MRRLQMQSACTDGIKPGHRQLRSRGHVPELKQGAFRRCLQRALHVPAVPESKKHRRRTVVMASPALPLRESGKHTMRRRDALCLGGGLAVLATPAAALADNEGWYRLPQATEKKTIVLTGANAGIGAAACRSLSNVGHDVHLVCRTMQKAERACAQLQELQPSMLGTLTPHECELGSMASIRKFAQDWSGPIDVLSLNAGAQFVGQDKPKRTEDGFELTVGVNHLGHFLLGNLLLPSLEQSTKRPRLVVTASEVHDPESPGGKVGPGASLGDMSGLAAGPRFDMVSGEPFDADKAYKDSKLCNVLFTREMSARLQARGSPVTANCFGPGLVTRSSFFRSAPGPFIGVFDFVTNNVLGVAETVQGGGDCLAYMAIDTALDDRSGVYFNNMTTGIPGISPGHEFIEKLPSREAQSAQQGQRLWDLSAKLTQL